MTVEPDSAVMGGHRHPRRLGSVRAARVDEAPAVGHPKAAQGILRPSPWPVATLAMALLAVVAITVTGYAVRVDNPDLPLLQSLNTLHSGVVGALATGVYLFFNPLPAIAMTMVLTALIWWRARDLRVAAAFAGMVAGTWLPCAIVKLVVNRPRPEAALLAHPFNPAQTDASFPSGHTVFVASLAVALVYLARGTRVRSLVAVLGAALVALVAASLTIDAVHYPADVLASIVWVLAVAPAVHVLWVDSLLPRLHVLDRFSTQPR